MNVLFVCVQNAGRSQLAEALFRRAAAGGHDARRLDPADAEWADVVVTMGCGDACPYIPGKQYLDWELDDPAGKSLDETRAIRDQIAARVEQLLIELGEKEPVHDAS